MVQAMAHPMAHPKFYIFTRKKKRVKKRKRDLLTLTDEALKDWAMAAMFCFKLIPRLFTALLFKMTGQHLSAHNAKICFRPSNFRPSNSTLHLKDFFEKNFKKF